MIAYSFYKKEEIIINTKTMNLKYGLTQIFFFASVCAMMGYASNYLLGMGCSNSEIGVTLALCSVIAVFLQPTLASIADRVETSKINQMIQIILAITIVFSLILYFVPLPQLALLACVVVVFSLTSALMPLINALAFVFEKYGCKINFGLARGLGSGAYALTSMIIGYVVNAINITIMPFAYILFNGLLYVVISTYRLSNGNEQIDSTEKETKTENNQMSMLAFMLKYKRLVVFLASFVCIYFAHTIINNFFIQVITNVGGSSSDMGNAISLAAFLEIPIMFLFNKINTKIKITTLLRVSLICFALKHLLTYLATNMLMVYAAQILQMGAFALFTPAAVYYVNQLVSKEDMVKGQSLLTASQTLSGVFASLLGGILLDSIGVHTSLLVGAILSFVGLAIGFMSVEHVTHETQDA